MKNMKILMSSCGHLFISELDEYRWLFQTTYVYMIAQHNDLEYIMLTFSVVSNQEELLKISIKNPI